MALKYIVNNNDGNSPIQTISGDLYANSFYGDGSNLTGIPNGGFSGNTSANCISNIWVENLYGCAGVVNVFTDLNVSDGLFANYLNANTVTASFVGDGSQLFNLPPTPFSGNTSGDCIADIWVQNLNGCDGTINVVSSMQVGGTVSATTFFNGVKRYVALLIQSGTTDPIATVLENSLGGTPVWTRTSDGAYRCTLNGAFTSDKTICQIQLGTGSNYLMTFFCSLSNDYCELQTVDAQTNTPVDFSNFPNNDTSVIIQVYP